MGHLELKSERYLDRPITHPEKITPALVTLAFEREAKKIFPHELPPLPYATDALEEVISEKTVIYHYGKHHKTYIDELNKAISDSEFERFTLEEIIRSTADKPEHTLIFNHAAQAWNHAFYWHSLDPRGGGEPPAKLKQMIEASFGSIDVCKQELIEAASTQFGSGWVWLVQEQVGNKLRVIKTCNARNPITQNLRSLLVIDVWEHAYYLDFQHQRKDHVTAVIDKLINWNFAATNIV
jgi:Fe-Mn family superoxide dismutase